MPRICRMCGTCHMKGYMKGASTLPEEKITKAASSNKTRINGINHHFFSCRAKDRNSFNNCHMSIIFVRQFPTSNIMGRVISPESIGRESEFLDGKASLPGDFHVIRPYLSDEKTT